MDSFSISKLSQLSGIKAHTIRIWEQRYNALNPSRTEGNTRTYSGAQLRRLLNIVSLSGLEYKVSELSSMSDEKLCKLTIKFYEEKNSQVASETYFISQLLAAGMSYDEINFDKIISHCFLRFGVKQTYVNVISPMLIRLGLMWASDSIEPAHEHFISNLIRQKLLVAIDALPLAIETDESWLLFLPENDFHEIGLLFAYFLIKSHRKKAIYLGGNLPFPSLIKAIKNINPTHLFVFFTQNDSIENTQEYLDNIAKNTSKNQLLFAGNNSLISQLKLNKKTCMIDSIEKLEQFLLTNV